MRLAQIAVYIFITSLVGILVYISEMSNDAIFRLETNGISDRSLIS